VVSLTPDDDVLPSMQPIELDEARDHVLAPLKVCLGRRS
jgi:hypothetical protein